MNREKLSDINKAREILKHQDRKIKFLCKKINKCHKAISKIKKIRGGRKSELFALDDYKMKHYRIRKNECDTCFNRVDKELDILKEKLLEKETTPSPTKKSEDEE